MTQSAEVSPQSIPPPPIEDSTLAASTSEEQSHKEDENPSEEPVADTETAREEPASTAGEITDNAVPIIEAPIIEKPDEAEATQQPEPGDTEEQSTESGVDAITEETAAVATSEDAEEGEGDGTIDAGSDEVEQEKREGEVHEPENAEQAKNTGASDKTNNDTPGMPEGGFDTEAEGLNTSGAPLAPSLDHADNADVVEATRPPASENEASKGDEIPSSSDVIVQHSLEERSIRFADDVRNPQPFATSYKTGRKKPSKVKSRTGDNKLSTTSANNDPPGEVERRGSSPSDLSHRNTTKLKCKGKNSTRVGKLENVANDGGKSENKAGNYGSTDPLQKFHSFCSY